MGSTPRGRRMLRRSTKIKHKRHIYYFCISLRNVVSRQLDELLRGRVAVAESLLRSGYGRLRSVRMANRLDELRATIRGYSSVLVCFSGGVDSALVLAVAAEQLGDRALGLTAVSPSLLEDERLNALALASKLGAAHEVVESREIEDPRYVENSVNRCFYCKSELYTIATRVAASRGLQVIANGTNRDDLGDYRPGLEAARNAGVRSPLAELGMSKADVRDAALAIGLEVWDKPASACLSSRIPYGTSVTRERLRSIGQAESALRRLGLRQVRVRFHDQLARVEVAEPELPAAFSLREEISRAVRAAGFKYVTLDLEGYRVGSHNEVVRLPVVQG
jgi:uncharacterized protein